MRKLLCMPAGRGGGSITRSATWIGRRRPGASTANFEVCAKDGRGIAELKAAFARGDRLGTSFQK